MSYSLNKKQEYIKKVEAYGTAYSVFSHKARIFLGYPSAKPHNPYLNTNVHKNADHWWNYLMPCSVSFLILYGRE